MTAEWRRIALLALGHGTNDAYVNFLAPLLPLIVDRLGISLGQAGLLATVLFASSSLSQPLYGLVADRMRGAWFVALGPTLTVAAMSLITVAPTFGALVALLVVGGIGTAAFHPQSTALAGNFGGPRRAYAVSAFVAGGEVGYGLGPLYATGAVSALGAAVAPVAAIPGLAACALLWRGAAGWQVQPTHRSSDGGSVRPHLGFFAVLWSFVVTTRIVNLGFLAFLSLLAKQRGGTLFSGGVMLSVYIGAGVAGGILGTLAAERIGRRAVMAGSQVLALPFLYAFLHTGGPTSYVALAVAGALMVASGPVIVTMAQERLPGRAGVASSIVMGFAWGTASLAATVVGRLADRVGLDAALGSLLVLLPLAAVFVLALPGGRRAPTAA